MPRFDEDQDSAGILAALEAIDATLAGEPVDPDQAEVAELALLLAAERPAAEPRFAAALDEVVQRRFAPAPGAAPGRVARVAPAVRRRWWLWTPAAGLAAALIAAVVIVVAGGDRSSPPVYAVASSSPHRAPAQVSSGAVSTVGRAAPPLGGPASSAGAASSSGAVSSSNASVPTLPPPASGRKTIQGGQLALSTAPGRVELVAQEVFAVIGQVRGIVNSSTVTATGGPSGYAQFQLSIPSSMLPQAMASLSTLRYAKVASRTDTTQDVNDQYESDVRALADARALRTSLLRQLANATTQAQIDSLTARIHDAEASIASDQATLRGLNRQIDYSQVGLTINGGIVPVPVTSSNSGGGFGLGQAAHDAGRVLTVAAGITLIVAAGLVPVGLVGGLVAWIVTTVRRRRREQVLDLA